MDNGLIFPYPLYHAHAEPGDTKHAIRGVFRDIMVSVRPYLVVGKPMG